MAWERRGRHLEIKISLTATGHQGLKGILSLDAKIYWWRSWASGSNLSAGALEAFLGGPSRQAEMFHLCLQVEAHLSKKALGLHKVQGPFQVDTEIRGVVLGVRNHLQSSS